MKSEAKKQKAQAIKEANATPITLTKGEYNQLLNATKKATSKPVNHSSPSKPAKSKEKSSPKKKQKPKEPQSTGKAKKKNQVKATTGKKQHFHKGGPSAIGRKRSANQE